MTPSMKKSRQMEWAVAGGTLLTCLAAMYLLVYLNVLRLQGLQVEERQLATELETLTQMSSTVNAAEIALTGFAKEQEALARRLPITVDFGNFYGALTEAASESGASLETVTPSATITARQYVYLPVEIQVLGDFPVLHDFLYRVTHLQRLAKVEKAAMVSTDDPGKCELSLTLHIFASVPEGAV